MLIWRARVRASAGGLLGLKLRLVFFALSCLVSQQGNPWASVALHAHALRANQSIGRMDDGDIPLRLVRDHGQHAVVVEILGTKNQVFEVGWAHVLTQPCVG